VLGLAFVVISPPIGIMLAWAVPKTLTAQHWLVVFIAALTLMGLYGLSLAFRASVSWVSVSSHGVARSRLMRAAEHVSWSNVRSLEYRRGSLILHAANRRIRIPMLLTGANVFVEEASRRLPEAMWSAAVERLAEAHGWAEGRHNRR
jgi:hypothetical protein